MHEVQTAILHLANEHNLGELSYQEMANLVEVRLGYNVHKQTAKHHFEQLLKRKMLTGSKKSGDVRPSSTANSGLLLSLPIMGNANCGEALEVADDKVQGYVQISKRLIHVDSPAQLKRLFGLRAVGESMNTAAVGTKKQPIVDGDIVLVDPSFGGNTKDKYMVAVIEGAANIKRVVHDPEHNRVVLRSESNKKYPDIYLHEDDLEHVFFAGEVKGVIKA